MKQISSLLLLTLLLCGPPTTVAQQVPELPDASSRIASLPARGGTANTAETDRMAWWREARFGMFIHWGLYAVPAGEWNGQTNYGEWIRTSAQIPLDTYDRFRTQFNPVQFDADAWVRLARDAGMKYIVITSKHHDGFCMFPSAQTDFDIMNTPYARDPMKDLAEACRKYDIRFCFYHSIMDWHHPDYLPRRDWEKDRPVEGADYRRYVDYMKAQLKELLTRYGDLGVLWFDGEWESTWNEQYGREIYNYVRSLQPSIIVNNRVGAGRLDMEGLTKEGAFGGDFGTPEQQIPPTGLPGVDWETCMTMNDHWGYNKADRNFKSTGELIRMLADIASKGGNYLLNVGPTAEGLIPKESVIRLAEIGNWMKINGEAIQGTQASPFRGLAWGRCTRKASGSGTTLYLHVFDWPANGLLTVPGLLSDPEAVRILGRPGVAVPVSRDEDALILTVPREAPDTMNTVIALELKGQPDITDPPVFVTEYDQFTDSIRVIASSNREKVEIRYAFGTTDPGSASPLYSGPFTLKEPARVGIRCFRDGKPVSATVWREFRKVIPVPALPERMPGHPSLPGLRYRYYEGEWDSLPDFNALKPVRSGIQTDFGFSKRSQDERFAFVYEALVNIPETGVYTFFTASDDGSGLWIDGTQVVNNDGLHGMQEKQGDVALEKGHHRLRVEFFERTGSDLLTVSVRSATMPKKELPAQWMYIPD